MTLRLCKFLPVLLFAACDAEVPAPDDAKLDALAVDYVRLELGMGQQDEAHVDAYFGPEQHRQFAEDAALDFDALYRHADRLAARLVETLDDVDERSGRSAMRIRALLARLNALQTRINTRQGELLPFDDESKQLFGVRAPDHDAAHFEEVLAEVDSFVPGEGSLATRVNAYRMQFVIPIDKLPEVIGAAIAECRRRTLAHIELPENESFTIEYVTDQPWSGYNWFQGGSTSLIQINTDLPIFIDRAVDLGCHEGYPGHHTLQTLQEQRLANERGWAEYTIYPLWSPSAFIAEGSGNYGIELAFPGDERIAFETEVLWPLAGLNAVDAMRYYALLDLLHKLKYAVDEAARDYLNGVITREEAEQWLVKYALSSPESASQRVDFIETYRSYVINYNFGKDVVREYVERDADTPEERWAKFEELLTTPILPQNL